ncbi:MAG: hypothetical protein ABIP95_12810 [Pelobium sp.]
MISIEKVLGKTFISGSLAKTDIHNGGTIFGIIYNQYLEFISKKEVKLTNKVTFNRGMKDWQNAKESEIWIGAYSVDSDNKHIKCNLTCMNLKKNLYIDFIDEETLLCEEYLTDENGSGCVFSRLKTGQ